MLDPARTLERARCGLIIHAQSERAPSRAAPGRIAAMTERLSAVLVRDEAGPLAELSKILEEMLIETRSVRSTRELARLLRDGSPPGVIFTGLVLADGTWRDVIRLLAELPDPPCLIVVSPSIDIPAYLDALESGACDFITPPFAACDVRFVIKCTLSNVRAERAALPRAASSTESISSPSRR